MKKNFYALLFSIFTLGITAQNYGPNSIDEIDPNPLLIFQESNKDSLITWQEKVVVHLSDDRIGKKGAIFFKVYLLTGLNQIRLNMSNVLNVELIDQSGEVLKRQYHPIIEGMVAGNLELPKKIKDGKYYLRAYTRWMKNYGEASYALKPILIYEGRDGSSISSGSMAKPAISIESGNMVSGLMNRIVLNIPSTDGSNANLTGQIADQNGSVVGEVIRYTTSLYTGGFIAERGMTYKVKMSDGRIVPIADSVNEGFVLQVNNMDPQNASVRVGSTPNYVGSTIKLLGSMNGVTYLEKYININETGQVDFEISKTDMPRGVMRLRLLDNKGVQRAQRPIWIEGNQLNIDVRPMEGSSKDELAVQITVTDQDNNPIQTELALGINHVKSDQSPFAEEVSTFNVNDLFVNGGDNSISDKDRRERFLRDIKLLSNAAEIEQKSIGKLVDAEKILYPFQQGLELFGFAYDLENNLLPFTDIQVMAFAEDEGWYQDLRTDAEGRIFLQDIQLRGEAKLIFRTNGDDTQERLVKVVPAANQYKNNSKSLKKDLAVKQKKRVYEPTNYQLEDTTGLIKLDEVILKDKSLEKRATPSLYNIEPTHVRYQDPERPKTLPELLLDIPGLIVRGLGTINPSASLLRGGNLLWVVDGFPIAKAAVIPAFDITVNPSSQPQAIGRSSSTQLSEVMTLVSAMDVEKIELLVGPDAAFWGSRASGGVIMIYTRTASNLDRVMRKDAQLTFQGYEANMNFEDYMQDKSRKAKQAINTLYWNPRVQTDANGKAVVRMIVPNADDGLYIKASTITTDGRIGVYESVLRE